LNGYFKITLTSAHRPGTNSWDKRKVDYLSMDEIPWLTFGIPL
jgi:hypothetical protein